MEEYPATWVAGVADGVNPFPGLELEELQNKDIIFNINHYEDSDANDDKEEDN